MAETSETTETPEKGLKREKPEKLNRLNPTSVLNAFLLRPKLIGYIRYVGHPKKSPIFFYPITLQAFAYLDSIKSKLIYTDFVNKNSNNEVEIDTDFSNNICTSLYIVTHTKQEIDEQLLKISSDDLKAIDYTNHINQKLQYLALNWAKHLSQDVLNDLMTEFIEQFSIISSVGVHGTSSSNVKSSSSNGFLTTLLYFAIAELHLDYETAITTPLAIITLLRTEYLRTKDVKMMTLTEIEDM